MVGVVAVVAVVGLVVWTVRVILPPLILAGAIVFLLNPAVTALHHRGVPRALGAGMTYLAVAGVITLAGVLVVPLAGAQAREFSNEWPDIKARAERWIDARAEESKGRFYEFNRKELGDAFSNQQLSVREQFDRVLSLGVAVFHVVLIIVLAPIIAFYLLVDLPHIRKVAESLVPAGARDDVLHVSRRLNRAIGGFFRGQLMVATIVGVLCSVGLAVIGLRFWFLVGMVAGFFNIIPLIGPWVGGLPGVMIALTTGSPLQALGVVVIMVGVQQVDNHFVTPQVMHRAVQLHPAAVILALLAGGQLGGFLGLLFAVPLAAALKIIASHVWHVHVLGEPLPPEHEDEGEEAPGLVKPVISHDGPADEGAADEGAADESSGGHRGQERPPMSSKPTVPG